MLKKQKQEKEEENEHKKSKLTDIQELSQVRSWFATCDEIHENKKITLAEGNSLKENLEKEKELLKEKIGQANQSFFINIASDFNAEIIETAVQNYLADNEIARKNLEKQTISIETKRALHQYASTLTSGEPCPLCGSEHHPAVLHEDGHLSGEITEIENQRVRLQKLDQSVRRFQSIVEKDFGRIDNLMNQLDTMRSRLKAINERITRHESLFVWAKFDKSDRKAFDEYFSGIEKIQKEVKENDVLIKSMTAKIESDTEEKVEKIEKPLQNLKNEILRIENTVFTLSGQLEKVKLTDFNGQDKAVIIDKIAALKHNYQKIKELYEKTEREIDILEKEKIRFPEVRRRYLQHLK